MALKSEKKMFYVNHFQILALDITFPELGTYHFYRALTEIRHHRACSNNQSSNEKRKEAKVLGPDLEIKVKKELPK